MNKEKDFISLSLIHTYAEVKNFIPGITQEKVEDVMSRIRIESKDGRVTRIAVDTIIAVDYQNGDNFINIVTPAGTWSVYFNEIEAKRLDTHAQNILSGGRLKVDTVVFSK